MVGGNVAMAQPTMDTGAGGTTMDTGAGGPSQNQTFTKLQNPLKADSVEEIIFLAVDVAMYLGAIVAVLLIIFVGFKFVFAQGKAEELKKAKMWLLYIVIGLAILISAKVIVEIVKNTLVKSGVVDKTVFTLPN